MGTVNPTITELPYAGPGGAWLVTWAGMVLNDVGVPVEFLDCHDRSVQVTGTFGAGGNCRIEGSNDGTNWYALNNPAGTALNLSAAGVSGILEATHKIRPEITAGDGTTSLTVSMFLRRTR